MNCVRCQKSFHLKCAGLTSNQLKSVRDCPGAVWLCLICRNTPDLDQAAANFSYSLILERLASVMRLVSAQIDATRSLCRAFGQNTLHPSTCPAPLHSRPDIDRHNRSFEEAINILNFDLTDELSNAVDIPTESPESNLRNHSSSTFIRTSARQKQTKEVGVPSCIPVSTNTTVPSFVDTRSSSVTSPSTLAQQTDASSTSVPSTSLAGSNLTTSAATTSTNTAASTSTSFATIVAASNIIDSARATNTATTSSCTATTPLATAINATSVPTASASIITAPNAITIASDYTGGTSTGSKEAATQTASVPKPSMIQSSNADARFAILQRNNLPAVSHQPHSGREGDIVPTLAVASSLPTRISTQDLSSHQVYGLQMKPSPNNAPYVQQPPTPILRQSHVLHNNRPQHLSLPVRNRFQSSLV
ncbi:AAEL004807-PA [Aedes aegypti]|uniref:AAEL004807-PA n=1 Tax=Aedes aegypti TaxID=7159 RepID=Q17BU2_AEDAE|nr:AAEL004807-PA [Aedes aegypti]